MSAKTTLQTGDIRKLKETNTLTGNTRGTIKQQETEMFCRVRIWHYICGITVIAKFYDLYASVEEVTESKIDKPVLWFVFESKTVKPVLV